MDVVFGEPVHHQKQRLGDEGKPAEVDHLLQLGVDGLQNVQVFRADEERQAIDPVATHGRAGERLRSWIGGGSRLVVESDDIGGAGAGQEQGSEVGVFHPGKGE